MEKLEKPEYIIIHHSSRLIDHPTFIRLRHRYFRKWEDTGYHFLIGNGYVSKNGKLYTARSIQFVGAHAIGWNRNSIGVCLIGNYDRCTISVKQYRTLFHFLISLSTEFKIPIANILGHNEIEGCIKSCPGKNVSMVKIRKILTQYTSR